MKKIFLFVSICTMFSVSAQIKTPAPSPAATLKQVVGLTDVEINYSRPSMKGRTIFGDLVPFGKLWRTGANANTTVSFSEEVTIDGKTLPKGSYALFTTPKADSWEIVFYSDTNNWGTPDNWDESKVALRANAKPEMVGRNIESLTIGVNNLANNFATLDISWEKTLVSLKFEVPTQKTALASIEKAMSGPSAQDYFSAAQYYYQSNMELPKALAYVNKAVESNKDKPFWMYRLKSLIQAKMGDKKGAIESAKTSMAMAAEAKNNDYVKMNNESIAEWSRK